MMNKAILLVEDNPDDEELTLLALQHSNIINPIVIARDGAEALEYLFGKGRYVNRDTSDVPQLVLLDLNLPKVGGLEVLQEMRIHPATKLVPVVVLTSSSEEEDILNSYTQGANSYVRKPVDFNQFVKAVGQMGVYWLIINQPPQA